jgi:hypothetical protein
VIIVKFIHSVLFSHNKKGPEGPVLIARSNW